MPVIARDFTESDRKIYCEMSNAFYASDAVCRSVPQAFFVKTFELCLQKSPFVRGLIIEYENRTAGYVLLSFTYSNEAGGMVVLIEEALVLPRFQGKGIVSKVFDILADEYDGKAARYRLDVTKENGRATRDLQAFRV